MSRDTIQQRTKTFVLYDDNERTFSQFDRDMGSIIGNSNAPTSDLPEKRLVEDRLSDMEPSSKYPVAIIFDNRVQYQDDTSEGAEEHRVHSFPLFSYAIVQQLEGRLLDYIDATYAEKEQREAQKRVVRKLLWGYHSELVDARKITYKSSKLVSEDNK